MNLELETLPSIIVAISLLFAGQFLVQRVTPLRHYNIPVPVVGGLLFASLLAFLHTQTEINLQFNTELKNFFMLAFFAAVGLTADLGRLKRGGFNLVIFLLVVTIFLLIQNVIGASIAYLLDLHPAIGLITGSITLSGGHGTGSAWAERFVEVQNLTGAVELAVASATFGLVIGGLLGGPVSQYLITRHKLQPSEDSNVTTSINENEFQSIQAHSVLGALLLIMVAVITGEYLYQLFKDAAITLPAFIWALFVGVLLRNLLGIHHLYQINEKSLDLLSTLALWLALAFVFMGLKLWELLDLAGPLLIILLVQTVGMAIFAIVVTFRALGANYDAAVMAAGHCGFCMGATPTAIANMQAVTTRYGPSPQSYIVVPMIGAFFIDLVNAMVIQFFLSLPIHGF